MIAEVYPILKLPRKCTYFDYVIPDSLGLNVGDLVSIPFKGRETCGIVKLIKNTSAAKKLLAINSLIKTAYLKEHDIRRYETIADHIVQSVSSVLHTALPTNFYAGQPPLVHASKTPGIGANDVSVLERCLHEINEHKLVAIAGDRDIGFALAHVLRRKRPGQLLVLLPREREVELLARYVKLGEATSLLHGKTKPKDRAAIVEAWRTGKIDTLIGTRAASLLAAHKLETVCVLEAGSDEYINERRNPRFDAREAVKLLAEDHAAHVVFFDSFPRLEELASTSLVITHEQSPDDVIINLGSADEITSEPMLADTVISGIETALQSQKKVLVCLNRKGVAKRLQCGKCGHVPLCGSCGHVPVVRHDDLVCPNCQTEMWIPSHCPACGKPKLALRGIGGAKMATTLQKLFPNASIGTIEKGRVETPAADIVIATEYFFSSYLEPFTPKRYGLIVDLAADITLHASDFRGAEKTARKLHRLIDFAKRQGAQVLVQTWLPEVLRPMLDLPTFVASELALRKRYNLPPFGTRITLEGIKLEALPPELAEQAIERDNTIEMTYGRPGGPSLRDLPDAIKIHFDGPYV